MCTAAEWLVNHYYISIIITDTFIVKLETYSGIKAYCSEREDNEHVR